MKNAYHLSVRVDARTLAAVAHFYHTHNVPLPGVSSVVANAFRDFAEILLFKNYLSVPATTTEAVDLLSTLFPNPVTQRAKTSIVRQLANEGFNKETLPSLQGGALSSTQDDLANILAQALGGKEEDND